MYSQESRAILFKLSLKKMDSPVELQHLVQVVVSYTNTLTGLDNKTVLVSSAARPASSTVSIPMPAELDKHITRYTAASNIEAAVLKANENDFKGAKQGMKETIQTVKKSRAAQDPGLSQYCEDLVADLTECMEGMEDLETFSSGIHYAHAFSTMYYMERSTGTSNLLGVDKQVKKREKRHTGYGYVTYAQEAEGIKAKHEVTNNYVTGYLEDVL